jgi:hypothetical protein
LVYIKSVRFHLDGILWLWATVQDEDLSGLASTKRHDWKFMGVTVGQSSRDGLVGYDAALTQLRSRVQFPVFVF